VALLRIFENLHSPSKHGRQQTISNTNEIKLIIAQTKTLEAHFKFSYMLGL